MKRYSTKVVSGLFTVILFAMFLEISIFKFLDKKNSYNVTNVLLNQIIELINNNERNSQELYESVKDDYKIRAQSVSYILDLKPSTVYDIDELKKIARLLSIDEIHIFDQNGKIYSGSVPKYWGLSFDSGEQMSYFKPMLSDKSLSMCQDVTPNTSEGKLMMYAITWNEKGDKMIQIGIEPFRLIEAMKRNEITTKLKEMPVYNGIQFFVADADSGLIIGSSDLSKLQMNLSEICSGLDLNCIEGTTNKILKINGQLNCCSYAKNNQFVICVARSTDSNNTIFIVTMVVFFVYLLAAGSILSQVIISRFKAEEEKIAQFKILSAMSQVFYSMHLFNLNDNSVQDFTSNDVERKINRKISSPQIMLQNLLENGVDEDNKAAVSRFLDLSTLDKRLFGKQIISIDFSGSNNNWYKASFIVISYGDNNKLEKVLLTLRNITEEKDKEQLLLHESNTDELTGVFNRRAFQTAIKNLDLSREFIYLTYDLNGLKNANDTIGHEAGDELIITAAKFLKINLGKNGKIYRTGGDEFSAILDKNTDEITEKLNEFNKCVAGWTGVYVQHMAISCGMVSSSEKKWESVREIIKEADRRMYADKERYYQNNGIDRRAYQKTYTSLGVLYAKILKINLTKDSYRIVKVDKNEQIKEKGYETDSISAWMKNFGNSGQVHKDDLDNYLKKTDIEFLRNYMKNKHKYLSILYRRKIDQDFKQVLMEIIPSDDYSDEEQNCYLYVKDISGTTEIK